VRSGKREGRPSLSTALPFSTVWIKQYRVILEISWGRRKNRDTHCLKRKGNQTMDVQVRFPRKKGDWNHHGTVCHGGKSRYGATFYRDSVLIHFYTP